MSSSRGKARPGGDAGSGCAARRLLAAAWAVTLAMSMATAARFFLPRTEGRVILSLIFAGYLLFWVARTGAGAWGLDRSVRAAEMSRPLRAVYWLGYALMGAGAAMTAACAVIARPF
jgi:hypothetical protein